MLLYDTEYLSVKLEVVVEMVKICEHLKDERGFPNCVL